MISSPVKTSERVYIDHIPKMEWDKYTENSFVRSSQLALNALGEDFSYHYLMGISGAAFKFQFNLDWCPSVADATTGYDVSENLFKSAGYRVELIKIDDNKFTDIQKLYRKIKLKIDQGIPIIAINLKACPEWGIITGYLKKRPGIICRTYFDEGEDYSLAEHAPWLSFFIHEKIDPLDQELIFLNSIKIAIKLAKTDSFENYKSGLLAFEYWIDQLKAYINSNNSFEPYEVNLTMLYVLVDARRAAFNYLDEMRKHDQFKYGDAIINNYKKEYELLIETIGKLPGFKDNVLAWTNTLFSEQIRTIEQITLIEKETIDLLEESVT